MYIKLGTIGVNYPTTQYNDFMIFSEVPDSTLSYEKPVIVRTLDELDIWFGRSMSDYPQLVEIIRNGGSLYMYKPISNESRDQDIDSWPKVWYDEENQIPLAFPTKDSNGGWTYVGKDGGYHLVGEGKVYNFDGTWYTLIDGALVKESDLPQNSEDSSVSMNNRDTLLLSNRIISHITLDNGEKLYWDGRNTLSYGTTVFKEGNSESGFIRCGADTVVYKGRSIITNNYGKVTSYIQGVIDESDIETEERLYDTYPNYDYDTNDIAKFSDSDTISNVIVNPDSEGNTFAIKITYPKNTDPADVSLGDGYFVYTTYLGRTRVATSGTTTRNDIPGLSSNADPTLNPISTLKNLINFLASVASVGGDGSERLGKLEDPASGCIILHSLNNKGRFTFDNLAMFSNPDIKIEIDEETNNKLMFNYVIKSGWPSIFFWSKTIGRDSNIYDDTRDISVKIENLGDDLVRVEIGRYDYSEVFTGSFNIEFGKETLDNIISKNSKLVNVSIDQKLQTGGFSIQDCEFKLQGAKDTENEDYWKSLELLLNNAGDPVCPDFVMIPHLDYWFPNSRNDKRFLDLAEKYNTQFLISEYSEEDVQENLLEDKENRLVYFYGNLSVSGINFPPHYPFIMGVLKNSSVYVSKEIENTIIFGNNQIYPYTDTADSLELDKYKCNYLVSNNQRYYYRKYNSGEKPITTAWRRFIIGKIYRELEKNKWEYLGTRFNGIIKNKIEEILRKIANSFSMVRKIEISSYYPIQSMGMIDMTIDVYTTDLVDSNVKLNILINYNKQYE